MLSKIWNSQISLFSNVSHFYTLYSIACMIKSSSDYKSLGNFQYKSGEYEKAIEQYTNAIQLDPSNPVYYSNRSMAYIKVNDYENALNDTQFALENLALHDGNSAQLKSKLEYRQNLAEKSLFGKTTIDPSLKIITLAVTEVNDIPKGFFKQSSDLSPVEQPELTEDEGLSIINKDQEITRLSVKKVDSIPNEFFTSEKNLAPTIKEQTPKKLPNLELQHKDLPQYPSISYLTTLKSKSPIDLYYTYVLSLPIEIYQDLFKISGIDDKFLEFYLLAAIWDLSSSSPQFSQSILQSIEVFTKLPRFALNSMFLPSRIKSQFSDLLSSKLNFNLNSIWK